MTDRFKQVLAAGSVLGMLVLGFQNCAPFKTGYMKTNLSSNTGSSTGGGSAADASFKAFTQTLAPTLKTNCNLCHATMAPKIASNDDQSSFKLIMDLQLVDLANPNNSHLVSLISGSHSGVPASVSTEIYEKVRTWAQLIAAPEPAPTSTPTAMPTSTPTTTPTPKPSTTPTTTPTTMPVSSVDAFRTTLYPVLTQSCGSCHGRNTSPLFASADATASHGVIVSSRLVVFSNSATSRLVVKVQGGHAGVSTSVVTTMRTQIDAWAKKVKDSGGTLPLN